MDQLDAFLYFLVHLGLHNLVLVVLAMALGLVLGRLVWGNAKTGADQRRALVKGRDPHTKEGQDELRELREEYEAFRAKAEAGGERPVAVADPELEDSIVALRKTTAEQEDLLRKAAEDLEQLSGRLEVMETDKEALVRELEKRDQKGGGLQDELRSVREEKQSFETQARETKEAFARQAKDIAKLESALAKATRRAEARTKAALPLRGGRAVDLERVEADKTALEKRLKETTWERDQVEEASAILRKELYGLRSKLQATEQKDDLTGDLEAALQSAEAKVQRLEETVTKEARLRADLEQQLAHGQDSPAEPAEPAEPADSGESDESLEPAGDDEEDDLKRIKGVGVVLEQKLKERGVTRLRQIAEWSDQDLEEISTALNLRNRAERGDWRGQARDLETRD